MARTLTDQARLIYNLLEGRSTTTLFPSLIKLWYTLSLDSGTTINPGDLGTNAATIASSTQLYIHKTASSSSGLALDRRTIAGNGLTDKLLGIYGIESLATIIVKVSTVTNSGNFYTIAISIVGGDNELVDGETVSLSWI